MGVRVRPKRVQIQRRARGSVGFPDSQIVYDDFGNREIPIHELANWRDEPGDDEDKEEDKRRRDREEGKSSKQFRREREARSGNGNRNWGSKEASQGNSNYRSRGQDHESGKQRCTLK